MFTAKEYTEAEHQEFRRELQKQTLQAFGLKPWHVGLAPVPRRVRIWRKVSFARWRARRRAEQEA